MKNKIRYNEPKSIVTAPTSMYWESSVRFSLRDCSTDKKFCIRKLDVHELERLYNTLYHFEQMSYKAFDSLERTKGFTPEIKETYSYTILKNKYPLYEDFGHFRVNGTDNPFRVFCARQKDLLCILLLDKEGSIHHS